jgi:secondary thiamine-phosphate synthase enzyme
VSITIKVATDKHTQAVDLTRQVNQAVAEGGMRDGWCLVYVPHTTAGVAVNEAADPSVMRDVLAALERLVPWQGDYHHAEGNSAAHIKSILTGSSLTLPVKGGRLDLGTWQGVFFMEFDGPRSRRMLVDFNPRA